MKAVVMAGGQGTRLRPLTSTQPKPMLPIVGQPMMQHVLRLARTHGITEVVATVQFLASVVRNYFGDGDELGISLAYVAEEQPLGTAGSVRNAAHLIDDRFLVLSGDSLTDIDLTDLIRFHEAKGAAVTVTLKSVPDPLEFGIVITDSEGRIERFLEKPGWGEVFSDTINTGIYVIEREVLDRIPEGEEFDFSKDLFPALLESGLPMYGYVTDRFWTDVGTIESYMAAQAAVLDRKVDVDIEGFALEGGIWLGEGAELDPDADVEGPVFIGENSRVEHEAVLREYTVLGRDVTIKARAILHRAVVHDHAYVGTSSSLRGCVLGRNSDVKSGAQLEEGVVVADQCHVGEGAVLNPRVKVYPFKTVDPGAIVTKSIVWQTGGNRGLFGERGVSGLMNIDITPEMVSRLALAYASTLPKGSTVVACRDATRSARLLKRAMMAGVNAGGVDVHDLELVPTPVARFYAQSGWAVGGFSVTTAPMDSASVDIQFFDQRGIDVDPSTRRQLERAFFRDDLRRAFHNDIGDLRFPARGLDYYVRGLLGAIDTEAIRHRAPKLVVDYAAGSASLTGPRVLSRLAGQVLGVNAGADEERVVLSQDDVADHLRNVQRLVRASDGALGAMIDSTGEHLRLVDGSGRVVGGREALLALVWLVASTGPARIALPVSTTGVAERIATEFGAEVVWTKVAPAALMNAAHEDKVAFAGSENGDYIFPEFLAAYDAIAALVKLLELLSRADVTLKQVVDQLPPSHVVMREVAVPWEAKGVVMRRILEERNEERVETVDGVKAFRADAWALVIPDPQEPLVRVWAEAGSERDAQALVAEFAGRVEELKL